MSEPQRGGGVARDAALTSVAQALAMIAGGVLAVLVAVRIGNDARTDGFFAAYGVYAVGVVFAQSARMTIVARIVEADVFDRYLGGGVVLFGLLGVVCAALGDPVAAALTGDLPQQAHDTARTSLLILWPALGGQLFGGLAATMLGTRGDFATPAVAFAGGGLVSIAAFLALEGALGIDAVAVSILIGSTLTAALLGAALLRTGWRPDLRALVPGRTRVRAAWIMTTAAVPALIHQAGSLVAVIVAARLGEGIVTIYSYSAAAVGIVMALLAAVPSIVLAAPLATTWNRSPEALLPHHRVVWLTGLLLFVPVVAGAWLIGDDVAGVLLAKFTDAEVDLTLELFLYLSPVVLCALAVALPQTALYTLGRYWAVAAVAAAALAVQAAVSLLAVSVESAQLMAAAVPIGGAFAIAGYLLLVSRQYVGDALSMIGSGLVRVGLIAVLAFALPALVLPDFAAFAAGLVLFVAAVAALLPDERDLGRRLLGVLHRSSPVPAGGQGP